MATDIPAGFAQERDPASFTSGASVINAPQEATEQGTAFQINGYYLAEVTRNFSGGARVGLAYLGNYGLRGTADLEKAFGWKGATSALYVQGTHGETPSDLVGSRQVTSSIQAPDNTARVYELWLQQSFLENRVSVLGGLIDLNSEFYVTDSSSIFMNSVFGIGQEIAQAGVQGPSAYPQTSLGLRVRGQFGDALYVQGVVLDGVPGEPGHNNGTHISVRKTDGVLTVVEAGLRKEDTSKPNSVQKYSLGLWRFSNGAVDAETAPNQGLYVLVNQPIATGLAGFLRYCLSAEADGFVRDNFSGGLSLTGALASREKDQLGLGFTTSSISPLKERETVLELTYKVNFSDTVFVQPDLQYVINPSADSTTPDAGVGMLRARLGF